MSVYVLGSRGHFRVSIGERSMVHLEFWWILTGNRNSRTMYREVLDVVKWAPTDLVYNFSRPSLGINAI